MKTIKFEFGKQEHIDLLAQYNEVCALRTIMAREEERADELEKQTIAVRNIRDKVKRKEAQLLFTIGKLSPKEAS